MARLVRPSIGFLNLPGPIGALTGMGLACAFLFSGCSKVEKPRVAGEGKVMPLTEYRDTTVLDMHDGSRLSWRLRTLNLVRWPGSELVRAVPVDLTVFDSTGALLMRVTADSGAVDEAVNFLLAQGNVHGVSSKGMDLRTDSLRWSKTLNQVTTEASVRVVSENGDILTGRGFVSDANLDHWQILSDVKGVFQDAGERAGSLDAPAGAKPPAEKAPANAPAVNPPANPAARAPVKKTEAPSAGSIDGKPARPAKPPASAAPAAPAADEGPL